MDQPAVADSFEADLPGYVQTLRVINGAMAAGIFFFAGVVLFEYFSKAPPTAAPSGEALIRTLSLANAVVFVGAWAASVFIYKSSLKKGEGPFLRRVLTAEITRLAMREGPAFLGLVVCLLATVNGVLSAVPLYWANGLSAFAFWVFALRNLMTIEDRVRELYSLDCRLLS